MKRFILPLAALALGACGSDPGLAPTVEVNVFGWSSGSGFISSMPPVDDAQTVRVKVTRPEEGTVVATQTFAVGARTGNLPDVPFGTGLRMDFEVLDSQGGMVASGATPTFGFSADDQLRTFRVQVTEVNTFSPVGNVVVDRETGERKFAWTQLDYRGKEGVTWLGRIGHATATTSDGRVIVVGGGDPVPGAGPAALPEFRSVYTDIQIFDPETGYFTDLAYDAPEGKDVLFEATVFHTVTPIGNDRFLVVGGFTPRADVLRPVNTIQVIDLNAPVGARVQRFVDGAGSSLVLKKARGWHTASFRKVDNHVIVAGGVGAGGEDDVLGTFEMIDLATSSVYQEPFDLQEPRAQHNAVLMGDGRTIWLIGGRDGAGAVASSEIVGLADGGMTETSTEATMRSARYEFAAVRLSEGGGDLVLVAGGFTDRDGAVSDSFEVSRLGRGGTFDTGTEWKLSRGRGGAAAIALPQSGDIVILGGRNANGDTIATADTLTFDDLAAQPPFTASESRASVTPRFRPSVDLLSNGRILLVGGEGEVNGADVGLDTADMYNPEDPVGGGDIVVVNQ